MHTTRLVSRRFVFFCFLLTVLLFAGPQSILAGKLEDFEKDATKEDRRGKNTDDDWLTDLVVDVLVPDRTETAPSRSNPPANSKMDHIPTIRLDLAYQNVQSDVSAWDIRGEVGSGPLAFAFRRTLYREEFPHDELITSQGHFLLRLSNDPSFEVDAGIGFLFINGKEEHTGLSVTIPVLFHPSKSVGFELRPTWSSINENNIQDIGLALTAGLPSVFLRTGYRWFRSDRESLDGPFIGMGLRW